MFGVGGDGDQRLGADLEQDVVDHRLVLIGDVGDRLGQGEDDVEIGYVQQLGLARRQPVLGSGPLALWAMAVAARIVGDQGVTTVRAARHMAAERRSGGALSFWKRLSLSTGLD